MKMILGVLTLLLALVISGVAAYFSVVGLAAVFAATYTPVIVMGLSLEAGKLVAAAWLHENWHNPRVNYLHKSYMTAAVAVLMLITSMGVFGFLAKGHTEQAAAQAPVVLQIAQKEARLEQLNAQLVSLNSRQTQLDAAINSIIADSATGGLRARRQQSSERSEISRGVEAANNEINAITSELVPLKLEVSAAETKLGPIKFIAETLGIKDTEKVVMIFILLLVVVFDPLAVILVLSGVMTVSEAFTERRNREDEKRRSSVDANDKNEPDNVGVGVEATVVEITQHEETDPVVDGGDHDNGGVSVVGEEETVYAPDEDVLEHAPSNNLMVELEHGLAANKPDDQSQLIDILTRRPDLLEDIVAVVQEDASGETPTVTAEEDPVEAPAEVPDEMMKDHGYEENNTTTPDTHVKTDTNDWLTNIRVPSR